MFRSLATGILSILITFGASARAEEPDVAALTGQLGSANADERAAALAGLGRMGPKAAEAVPSLIEALSDRDHEFREHVIHVLGAIGPQAKAAVPHLQKIAHDRNEFERIAALVALVHIQPEDGETVQRAVTSLVNLLKHSSEPIHRTAIMALGKLGEPAVPALLEVLDGSNDRARAIAALRELGPSAKSAVPALTKALADEHESVRWHAASALGQIGKDAAPAVDGLVKQLSDESPLVRAHAASALGNIAQPSDAAVAALIKTLSDKDGHVRREAAEALGDFGPAAQSAVPALIKTLDDKEKGVAVHAGDALADIGEPAVPALLELMGDEHGRFWAALVLAEMGPKAQSAVPALTEALGAETNDDIRRELMLALGAIGGSPDSIDDIAKGLESKQPSIRATAAHVLGRLGPSAKSATDKLTEALNDKNELVAVCAAVALVQIDSKNGDAARPVLERGAKSAQPAVKHEAREALEKLK